MHPTCPCAQLLVTLANIYYLDIQPPDWANTILGLSSTEPAPLKFQITVKFSAPKAAHNPMTGMDHTEFGSLQGHVFGSKGVNLTEYSEKSTWESMLLIPPNPDDPF